jgi:hypothetical protein
LKRRLIIVALAIAALATLLIVRHELAYRRASYQGKSARTWAAELYASSEPRDTNAAAVAFRAMGSNAVPALRSLLHLHEPVYETAFLKYARRIPTKPRIYLLRKLNPGRTIEYRIGAVQALGILGPVAQAAIPDLLTTLADSDSRLRWVTAQTIVKLGPEAVTALLPLLTNADVNLRHAAVYALGEARTNALPAVPLLIQRTMDTNDSIRGSAYYSLSRVGRPAFPVAVKMAATNENPEIRNAALSSLLVLLPPGRPIGLNLTTSTNQPEIRRLAMLALWRSRLTNEYAMALYQAGLRDEAPAVRDITQRILDRITSTNSNRFAPP